MSSMLIVEDDAALRKILTYLFDKKGYQVQSAQSYAECTSILAGTIFDMVLTDLRLGDGSGLDVLAMVKRLHADTEVIIMTAFGSVQSAVEAIQQGASDYITKPFKNEELVFKVGKSLERQRLKHEVRFLRQEVANRYGFDNIIGNSKSIQDLKNIIGRIAGMDIAVLLSGESGTGKELVAKVIHHHSDRRHKPFIPINCSAIPENLLESELFGHIKGSFTSAINNKRGLFEEANQGTVFLDEIGDLPYALQAKLLRVLQEQEIRPVGGNTTRSIDVRIIAATNANLSRLVQEGKFREDLYYRLNVMPITLAPLRDRPEDIPPLTSYFLRKIQHEYGRGTIALSPDSLELLVHHAWPGNVRELENTLKRAVALSVDDQISRDDIIFISQRMPHTISRLTAPQPGASLIENQKLQILRSLEENDWNYSMTASQLGIGRTTLWRKIRKFNLQNPAEQEKTPTVVG